ncbi:MAG: Threonine--tRNA ligase [Parcubacteria group bacterium ADurb.Bin326]|nr:MAG: Threonine--tRNA ligase [Parcubacteria group bacterium ADurb.Bin326]
MNEQLDKIRHSTSHVMAYAVRELFGDVKFAIGPTIDDGFYYDFDLGEKTFSPEDLKAIEKKMEELIRRKLPFEKSESTIAEALKKMSTQPYKQELIKDLEVSGETSVSFYTVGDLTDLCRGPHVENTSELGHFKLLRAAGAYWRGDAKNKMLQRIYGTAFATKNELQQHLKMLEEAEKRDHNKLGRELGLFITAEPIGQGLPLLTPKGTKIKQILQRWIEDEEEKRGYQLTMTPFMAKSDLYKISGHWDHYRDGMFLVDGSGEEMALRPMTCPFQFMIYKSQLRSYRDLPIRYNETSTLFRNEESGEMHGLIRLRQFTLSEGHLICRMNQLEEEFEGVLKLIDYVLKTLKLENYSYRFSKWDPANKKGKYIDAPQAWEESQAVLKKILDKNGLNYVEAEGEAAFYGPKLDIQMKNVYGKEDTIITVQIDFALPERFDMNYINEEGMEERPIIIHRSSVGCYERTIALLIEQFAGAFPTWLSPNQVTVIPISEKFSNYALRVAEKLKSSADIRLEVDDSNESLGKRIRNAEKEKTPYILVVGEKEAESGTVAVRKRGDGDQGVIPLEDFIKNIKQEIENKV